MSPRTAALFQGERFLILPYNGGQTTACKPYNKALKSSVQVCMWTTFHRWHSADTKKTLILIDGADPYGLPKRYWSANAASNTLVTSIFVLRTLTLSLSLQQCTHLCLQRGFEAYVRAKQINKTSFVKTIIMISWLFVTRKQGVSTKKVYPLKIPTG